MNPLFLQENSKRYSAEDEIMSCKMECPKCKKVLAIEGDEDKSPKCQFYRVYDSESNFEHGAAAFRALKCLECGFFADIEDWPIS